MIHLHQTQEFTTTNFLLTEDFHVPGCGRIGKWKSQADVFDIPEYMLSVR